MSIARALAILGAGASGYQGGQEQARQRSRQEEDDAFRREQRDRQRTDWSRSDEKYAREKADMEAERKNMAPVEGNPVFPTGDDEGNAMPMTPDMQRFTVAGTPGVLDASGVAAQNTPESRIRRAAAGAPDPARAAALNAQANASETAALQLDQARQTAVQQAWKRKAGAQIVGSQSWDAATKFMTESKADGMDGQTKWSYEESPDGKTVTIFSIDKDGKRGKGQQFENSDMGRMKLFTLLDTSTPIEAKMKDQQVEDNRVRDDQRQAARDKVDTDYKASLTNYHTSMAEAANTRASAASTRAGGRADHFDEKQWDAVRKVDPAIVSFDAPDGSGKLVESSDLRTVYIGELNRNRASGTMSPNEALEASRTVVGALREKASAMVEAARKADPKSTLTEPQAVKAILKEYQKALQGQQTPQAAPGAAPATGARPAPAARPAPPVVGPSGMQAAATGAAPGMGDSANERIWRAGGGPAREQAEIARSEAVAKARADAQAKEQRAQADPDIQKLMGAIAAAARGAGPQVNRAALEAQIAEIRKTRYGL